MPAAETRPKSAATWAAVICLNRRLHPLPRHMRIKPSAITRRCSQLSRRVEYRLRSMYKERLYRGISGQDMEIRMWDGHPTCDKISDEQCALLRESLAELVFLLFRQVGLNDIELLAFDCFNNLVKHSSARQQEQGRGACRDLVAHLVDKVVVNPIVSKVSGECTHRSAHRQAEEG